MCTVLCCDIITNSLTSLAVTLLNIKTGRGSGIRRVRCQIIVALLQLGTRVYPGGREGGREGGRLNDL